MKIIDLLYKIANEEIKYPIKWKCNGIVYEIEDETSLVDFHCVFSGLNDEIEIIEEPKKIEIINNYISQVGAVNDSNIEEYIHTLFEQQNAVICRLNKIIDYTNKENKIC